MVVNRGFRWVSMGEGNITARSQSHDFRALSAANSYRLSSSSLLFCFGQYAITGPVTCLLTTTPSNSSGIPELRICSSVSKKHTDAIVACSITTNATATLAV